jgi:hypothetical protein
MLFKMRVCSNNLINAINFSEYISDIITKELRKSFEISIIASNKSLLNYLQKRKVKNVNNIEENNINSTIKYIINKSKRNIIIINYEDVFTDFDDELFYGKLFDHSNIEFDKIDLIMLFIQEEKNNTFTFNIKDNLPILKIDNVINIMITDYIDRNIFLPYGFIPFIYTNDNIDIEDMQDQIKTIIGFQPETIEYRAKVKSILNSFEYFGESLGLKGKAIEAKIMI